MAEKRPVHHQVVDYTRAPVMSRFLASRAFISAIRGPVGSGKSSACCHKLWLWANQMPKGTDGKRRFKAVVVRNTYGMLLDTTVRTWLKWYPPEILGDFNKSSMEHHIQRGDLDVEILFRALDKPQDVDKLKSLDATVAWINEASEVPFDVLSMLETRVSRYPSLDTLGGQRFKFGIFLDTNPPDEDHWWYWLAEELAPLLQAVRAKGYTDGWEGLAAIRREVEAASVDSERREWQSILEACDDLSDQAKTPEEALENYKILAHKYEFFRQPSGRSREAENVENLAPSYYTRQSIGKPPEWIKVFVDGEYGSLTTGKPVFPEYNDSVHYNQSLIEPIRGLKILRGWDFGRTPAVLFSFVDPQGRWRCFDELCGRDIAIDEFGDVVKKHCAVQYPGFRYVDYCDPSGFFKGDKDERTCAQILAGKGIDVEGAKQNLTLRLGSVKKALRGMTGGKPDFQIGPKCKTLRKAMLGKYCFRRLQVSGERYTEEPDKTHPWSDIADCAEYTATMLYASDLLDPDFTPEGEVIELPPYAMAEAAGRSATSGY